MNTLIQKKYNHSETCITVEVPRRRQKVENYPANEESGLEIFSTDLGYVFGCNVGLELVVILRGKRTHKPQFSYELVHTHSLLINTDLNDYKIVGDRNTLSLRCFSFTSNLKAGYNIISKQYKNYQTFSRKNSNH